MKTKTERILTVLKLLAFIGGIGYAIVCGSELLSFVASFISPGWAKHTFAVDQNIFSLLDHSVSFYAYIMSLVIVLSAMKSLIWFVVADLLLKLKLNNPFSIEVAKKLEKISYLLFGIWILSIVGKIYMNWLSKDTGLQPTRTIIGDEYLFIAGLAYIISQIFKRGIEIQEENDLTV
jgi:hypothetical protein